MWDNNKNDVEKLEPHEHSWVLPHTLAVEMQNGADSMENSLAILQIFKHRDYITQQFTLSVYPRKIKICTYNNLYKIFLHYNFIHNCQNMKIA